MAVSGNCINKFSLVDSQIVGLATVAYGPPIEHVVNFTDGAGASKCEDIGSKEITIAGAPTDLDLAGGFTDLNGAVITFTLLKALMLFTPTTNVGDVTVGNDATAPWSSFLSATGTITLKPGTSVQMVTSHATGYAVTATTADILQVAGTSGDKLKVGLGGEV